jgi:hypothetical protein
MTLTNEEKATILARAYKWSRDTADVDGFHGHEFDTAPGFASMRKFWDDLVEVDMSRMPFMKAKCMMNDFKFHLPFNVYYITNFLFSAGAGLGDANGFVIVPSSTTEHCLAYVGDTSELVIPTLTYAEMEAEIDTINPRHHAPAREAVVDGQYITDV